MAIITLRTFANKDGSFEDLGVDTIDSTSAEGVKNVREFNKKANSISIPVLEDGTLDVDGIEAILKPGRRSGTTWTAEMVETAHVLRANEGMTDNKIMLEVYVRHGVEVTKDQVTKTLRQEINTEFELSDGLRDKVTKMTPTKGARKKYSDELKAEVVAWMRENDMSGVAAEEEFGIHNSQCNSWYREKYGYRRIGTGQVTAPK